MIVVKEDTCDFCGACIAVCPQDAIELFESRIVINQEECTGCKNCVKICPFEALEVEEECGMITMSS